MKANKLTIAGLLALMFACVSPVFAQTDRGGITGRVTDQTGAAIPDAKVTTLNLETSETREAKTNNEGQYTIPQLQAVIYTVRVEAAGFKTQVAVDLSGAGMRDTIARFSAESAQADAALIYTTGHGVEVDGTVYLLPGDYPLAQKNAALPSRALPVRDIGAGLKAKRVNLLFYGGCRDNPLGQ